MKEFFNKLITLGIFIIAFGFFYLAITVSFPSAFVNIVLLILGVFMLLQGCGGIDKIHGFGRYSGNTIDEKNEIIENVEDTNEEN